MAGAMIETIRFHARSSAARTGIDEIDPAILDVMNALPRSEFVPQELCCEADLDRPLPIGFGQTISQPFIVALMTQLVAPLAQHRVLDIGTGSGYQAAILSRLVSVVHSIELVRDLHVQAAGRLRALGLDNVHCHLGDGHAGLADEAPFDGIVVAAAAARLPEALIDQLAPGGRLVLPVGKTQMSQELILVAKDAAGNVSRKTLLGVAFVPLRHKGRHEGQHKGRSRD